MASMVEKDYYEILGVASDATSEQIRRAFQAKARELHPDVNKEADAEERFKEVSEAYAVLSDDSKRKRYDAMRSGNPFAGGSWQPQSAQGSWSAGGSSADWPFGWPFSGSYTSSSSRRPRAYRPRAGADIVYSVSLSADEARNGCRKAVSYQRYETCPECGGAGSHTPGKTETCPSCSGAGRIDVDLQDVLFGLGLGVGVMSMQCPECEGTGQVIADPCDRCGGSGRVASASEQVIEIPAGSYDGSIVRLAGQGNAGTNASASGDLVCQVAVPSERLSPLQSGGFQMLGYTLALVVLGFVMNALQSMGFVIALPLVMGSYFVLRHGITGHGSLWWRSALRSVRAGFINGAFLALIMASMARCSSSVRG